MAATLKDWKDHHYNMMDLNRKEIHRLEDKLRYANEQITVLAAMLSDKAEEAANLYPDVHATKLADRKEG